jgi:hypothetical protein
VDLDGERPDPTGGGVLEVENLDRLAGAGAGSERTAGHPGDAGGLVADDLALLRTWMSIFVYPR